MLSESLIAELKGDTRFLQIAKSIGFIGGKAVDTILGIQQKIKREKGRHFRVGEIMAMAKTPVLTTNEADRIEQLQKNIKSDEEDKEGSVKIPDYLQSILAGEESLIVAPKFSGEDKRKDKRVDVSSISLTGEVEINGISVKTKRPFRATLVNISAGGIRIRSTERLEENGLTQLRFIMGRNKFQLSAVIVGAFPGNCYGAQFVRLTEEDRLRIETVVGQSLLGSAMI